MNFREHISMRGKFKFKIFNSSGELKSVTEQDNFITSTGLSYPATYAFADCFRYVSMGSGTAANSISGGLGTTGLSVPLPAYCYIGSYDVNNNSQYENPSCGYREEADYVVLSRGWRVPTGTLTFPHSYTFNEFMVSPGRPYVKDANSPSQACHCSEFTNTGQQGLDCASIAYNGNNPYTQSFCAAPNAFARVVRPIAVSAGDFLSISYDLQLNFNTGIQPFSVSIANTATTNWSGVLTGRANMVHHGLKLVNDGVVGSNRRQAGSTMYGESVIPPWGSPMEPSCPSFVHELTTQDIGAINAYITTDNIQFLVNRPSGGTGISANVGEGLMNWHSAPTSEGTHSSLTNVRMDGSQNYYPLNTDFTQFSSADNMSFDVEFVSSSRNQHTPLATTIASSRSRTGNYAFQFFGFANPTFWNEPVRAMTLAYYDESDTNSFFPFYDIIFADRSGHYPAINNGSHTYALPNETTSPPTGYFYFQNGGNITMIYNMSWSSPCDSSVIGC